MSKKRILLVDDEKSFTNLLKLNLEDTGQYDVRVEGKRRRRHEGGCEPLWRVTNGRIARDEARQVKLKSVGRRVSV